MNGKYGSIIDMPHHVSPSRQHMSLWDRAAQFAPFAALTGYGDEITETARLTGKRIEPDEDLKSELDAGLRELSSRLDERPAARITYFLPDPLKEGGSYVTEEGNVKKIDPIERTVVFTDGTVILIDDIIGINGRGLAE
ncbi:MAG: hypothetical protein K5911_02455 [Eubacteriales bacterium]|nr:hypothetical protein [Eubacteriales bacterium]